MIKEQLIKEIKKIKINEKPIAIQIPEGLKQYAEIILDHFNKNEPIMFTDPCYGACDTKDRAAKELGCKLLIHFGHYKMNAQIIKTIYVPITYKLSKQEINYIIKEIEKRNYKKINIITTIQYIENLDEIKKILKTKKIKVLDAKETRRVKKHMVLGCDASTLVDKENPIFFIGDGVFHANNLGFINDNQKVIVISPISRYVKEIEISDKFIRRRYVAIALARKSKKFGILVSSKPGQNRISFARLIKKKLEENNKKAYILISDYIKQENLEGIKVDCYINTACPRLVYDDDTIAFKKPVLSVTEVDLIFDKDKELRVDQITSD